MYIYDVPVQERQELCKILDLNKRWHELGGVYMGFDQMTLAHIENEILRGQSPTDLLLTIWGSRNHTVLELFTLLHKMQHYQAMTPLKKFVDAKYHKLAMALPPKILLCDKNLNIPEINNLNTNDVKIINHEKKKSIDIVVAQVVSRENNESVISNNLQPGSDVVRRLSNCSITSDSNPCIPQISYQELEEATNHWAPNTILGKGGFGTVFKGIYTNLT